MDDSNCAVWDENHSICLNRVEQSVVIEPNSFSPHYAPHQESRCQVVSHWHRKNNAQKFYPELQYQDCLDKSLSVCLISMRRLEEA